jgi:hypothetical protein
MLSRSFEETLFSSHIGKNSADAITVPFGHQWLRAIAQIIETCPWMKNISFVQCDFTAETWMPLFAALCKVQAPEVTLGLIDCTFDNEAANQLKIFLHE